MSQAETLGCARFEQNSAFELGRIDGNASELNGIY